MGNPHSCRKMPRPCRIIGWEVGAERFAPRPLESPAQIETARKNERAVLHALASCGQRYVAEVSGISESRLSRMKDGGLEELCVALAAAGLKVVPADARVVTEAEYRFMAEQMVRRYQSIVDGE